MPTIKKPRPVSTRQVQTSHDPNAVRTLVITNLPSDITKAVLWKKVRKQEGAESVDWPVNGNNDTGALPCVMLPTLPVY